MLVKSAHESLALSADPCIQDGKASVCLQTSLQHPEAGNLFLSILFSFGVFLLAGVVCLGLCWAARLLRFEAKDVDEDQPPELEQCPEAEDAPYPKESVPQQFLQQAAREPNRAALMCADGSFITMEQLRSCAFQCAQLLSQHVDGTGDTPLVALYLHNGPRMVAAVLGVWFAGAAWTPLDRRSPQKRLEDLVKQIQPAVLLCDDAAPFEHLNVPVVATQQLSFDVDQPEGNQRKLPDLDQVAQVIFTSGSTGVPKGVIYTHGRLAHSTHFFAEECGGFTGCRVLQKTPNIWAVFRHEVYPALCRGGLIVHPKDVGDPRHLAQVINDSKVTLLVATPTILELILDSGTSLSSVQQVVCMGEPLSWRLAGKVLKQVPSAQLKNFYGSTETENSIYRVPSNANFSRDAAVPAGRPQPHVSLHLLTPNSMELSAADGEICFGGMLSSGYWQRPDLTAQQFVEHPQLGRLYRSGDLGRWGPGGLQVMGRIDRQVKVRGCRVELQEVEIALHNAGQKLRDADLQDRNPGAVNGLAALKECCAVVAKGTPAGHLQIVVFVSPDTLDLATLREEATAQLSPQLLPSLFTSLEQLPRLANGKADLMKLKTLASQALAKQDMETHAVLDSLGMLQHLTKSQLQEDRWIQNQQAFWTLMVMMEHFHLVRGAAVNGPMWSLGDAEKGSLYTMVDLCRCRDMLAFVLLLGFTDSRAQGPVQLGPRDAAVLIVALFMTFVAGPLHTAVFAGWQTFPSLHVGPEWFLYIYFWARLVLLALCRYGRPGLWQATFILLLSFCPDDLFWLQLPTSLRAFIETNTPFNTKSLKFISVFMPGCYLLSYHSSRAGIVSWCRRRGHRLLQQVAEMTSLPESHLEMSFSVACFSQWLVQSVLCGWWPKLNVPFAYQRGYQAVFIETGDHTVSWHYMTHPSLLSFALLWIGEALLLILPGLFVALGMAYLPWHFKTMGAASFGIYVVHVPMAYEPWTEYFQAPVLHYINTAWDGRINILIVLAWNIFFCLVFAHTIGVGFHHVLVSSLARLARLHETFQPPKGAALSGPEQV